MMSVQDRIAFFEALKATSSAPGATATEPSASVSNLVDLHEAIATPLPADELLPAVRTGQASSAASLQAPERQEPSYQDPACRTEQELAARAAPPMPDTDAASPSLEATLTTQDNTMDSQAAVIVIRQPRGMLKPRALITYPASTSTLSRRVADTASRLPDRLHPTRVAVVRASPVIDDCTEGNQSQMKRCRLKYAGSRLLDYRRSPKYLQQVAESKQRRAAALATLSEPRAFSAQKA